MSSYHNQNKKIVDIQFNNQIRDNFPSSKIYARAPAITFGGGGSDKLDYFSQKSGLCINAAIKKYAFCSISPLEPSEGLRISSTDYDKSWEFKDIKELMQESDPRLLIYQKVLSFLDFQDPVEIFTHCDFPIGSGLGGSSSLTVAILHAFSKLRGLKMSKIRLAKDAYKLERIAMNISGGWQDQYAASVGGVNAIFSQKNDIMFIA